MLHRCLKDHPKISGFSQTNVARDEGQGLQSVYEPAATYGGVGSFGFDRRSFLDEDSSIATKDNAKKIFNEWSRYWNLNKNILVEKFPPNLVKTRFLQELFPNSVFVAIIRHPIAVSYSTRKWA